ANKTSDTRINTITNLTWNIVDHLSFVGTAGYNTLFEEINNQQKQVNYFTYNDKYTQNPGPVAGQTGSGGAFYAKTLNRDTYYNLIGRIQYHNTFAKDHDVSVMAGSSYERDEVDNFTATTYDIADDNIPSLNLGVNST